MASNPQIASKLLRNLRDNGKFVLQCGSLTYIRSNAEKLEASCSLNQEEYAEICKLVMELSINGDQSIKNEAIKALHALVKYFKKHSLKFFESALLVERPKRLKIFQFLEAVEDESLVAAIDDPATLDFMQDCLSSVQEATMKWLEPSHDIENLQILETPETKSISEAEQIEENIVENAVNLLRRIYRTAINSVSSKTLEKFDALVMDKVATLAYMGHKRQRASPIKLMFEALEGDLPTRLKAKLPDVYSTYKKSVEGHFGRRMVLLVKACHPDWSSLWALSLRMLGTDVHHDVLLINQLLFVEEKAFKSTDTAVRREAFVAWKFWVDNLALDTRQLQTKRRVKLLMLPLTANNSRSETIAFAKLEVWWYLITKLLPHIVPFVDPALTQFLNFCFGPLRDTPLITWKYHVAASPGKRYPKTQIMAIDALLQMFVPENERILMAPVLEARLPGPMSDELFQHTRQFLIYSVGEAIMIICKLKEIEMKHKAEICKVLWLNLMRYVRATNQENKENVHKDLIAVITDLQLFAPEIEIINDLSRNTIIPELAGIASELVYYDATLVDLMTKVMVPTFLKNLHGKQCDAVKSLMWQTVRPETLTNYHPNTLQFLETTLQQLRAVPVDEKSLNDCFELWFAYAEIALKYMKALQDVNEGTGTKTNFKTIESIISFPYTHMYRANLMQASKIAVHWKDVYKKYECQADTITSIKPNQVFNNTSKMIEECVGKNEKCFRIAVHCLDALMATINYKVMLAQNDVPTIVSLIGDLTALALHEGQPPEAECALRALSSLLITVYGHSPEKVLVYMKVTSSAVELMLKTDADDAIVKEITSTWETIVSILRGLSNILDESFLQSYKQVISLSLKHSRPEISSQSAGILDLKDSVKENAKWILEELVQECRKASTKDPSKSRADKGERTPKTTRVAGSFLNRKTMSPGAFNRSKDESERKLAPLPPEPDSQDYVIIRSEIQVDVDRLTEHQKEIFIKRRDDIPAMYNDLSQSSSRDTQDLQQWFGPRNSVTVQQPKNPSNEEKSTKSYTTSMNVDSKTLKVVLPPKIDQKSVTVDPKTLLTDSKSATIDTRTPKVVLCSNIDTKSATIEVKTSKSDAKSTNVDPKGPRIVTELPRAGPKCSKAEEKLATANRAENPIVALEKIVGVLKATEPDGEAEKKVSKARKSPETISSSVEDPSGESVVLGTALSSGPRDPEQEEPGGTSNGKDSSPTTGETNGPDSPEHSQESFATKLNFDSREEYPEDEKNEETSEIRSSNKSGRGRRSGKVSGANLSEEKAQQSPVPKGVSTRGKAIGDEAKNSEIEENVVPESRRVSGKSRGTGRSIATPGDRGTKRKVFSDVENDDSSSEQEKKRRKSSRSSSGSEDSTPSQTAKKTGTEILRLRIDMVSDGPLKSRRRSKHLDDSASSKGLRKRAHSPDMRGRAATRGRGSSGARKTSRASETDDARTKRGPKSGRSKEDAKIEGRKENEAGGHETKAPRPTRGRPRKTVQESGAASESQLIVDDDETMIGVESTNSEETSKESLKDSSATLGFLEELAVPETPVISAEKPSETQTDVDFDEVVESSQDSSALMASHKRSFAKIAKLMNADEKATSGVPPEPPIENKQPRASSPNDPSSAETKDASGENIPEDPDETFLDISAIRPQLADDVPVEDPEKKAPEASKTTSSPVPTKPDTSLHFCSPKAAIKRFLKPKSFVPQGRTAHMLGLVAKFDAPEKDESWEKSQVEEEMPVRSKFDKLRAIARSRAKEIEAENASSRRTNVVREPERMGSPSGSRQEKIFNNMKSADYAASPPAKLFCNLKNNGEKISPKMEKSQASARENGAAGKDDENVSLTSDKEELPMLEWSSANPPSLTASPSASILKRNRSIVNEPEPEPTAATKMQRKRVSFADPPVSKEMGYEIEAVTSPHKISKFNTSRGLLGRRDSPIRTKQSRFMMIQVDTEKSARPEEPQILSCDVDVNCARDNELLVRIAEDLEETMNFQTPDKIEMEISATCDNVETHRPQEPPGESVDTCHANVKNVPIEETQTQDDLFNSSDEKNDSPKQPGNRSKDLSKESSNVSITSTNESFKLNVTEDSVIGSINDTRAQGTKSVDHNLEDTVDARNVMILSMEDNMNEQFDEIPIRTSTQGPDPISEMDTLPVTDSILNSQPNTIDSQISTQALLEISRPELLNSTQPIYPNLDNCDQPIDSIIDHLTNPLWRKNLLKYLKTRCIRTVGDLAKLSEREIVRIPVKGTSKIDFVRKVLQKYETKLHDSEAKNRTNYDSQSQRLAAETATQDDVELSDDLRKTLGDISLDTSKIQTDSADLDTSVLRTQPTNDFLSIDDLNPLQPLARTSTANSNATVNIDSTNEPEISMELEVTTELDDTTSVSRIKTIDLASDTLPLSTKSVATSTDLPLTSNKSVETQINIEELLDTVDVDVLLKSVVRRQTAAKLLMAYKHEMGQASESEMCKKTLQTLGIDNETLLKMVCRECGLKKVLCEIPKIFHDTIESLK